MDSKALLIKIDHESKICYNQTMRYKHLFTKTLRTAPKDETARGAQFLVRAGYIHKELAGVYDYLPLGLRVIRNIEQIIREELNNIGCQEILMSTLQNPEPWQKSDRWDIEKMDVWFRTNLAAGGELGLAPTHEEPLTNLMTKYISSYKDLPAYPYQFQTKFRNELRAKSGIMRGREFIMKDLYSFSADPESHQEFYDKVAETYMHIYDRIGIGDKTYQTFASGGVFSKYSHEFQTITEVGEDLIWYNQDKSIVLNDEVFNDEVLANFNTKREDFESTRAAEVGNIFTLGSKYSDPINLTFDTKDGNKEPVLMGCYGIGVSRVMGVVAEMNCDDRGLTWPESIAPYKYYLIGIDENGIKKAEEIYANHSNQFIIDDRTDTRPGEKFKDAELLGIPYRIVISDKTLIDNMVEVTNRTTGETKLIPLSNFQNTIA